MWDQSKGIAFIEATELMPNRRIHTIPKSSQSRTPGLCLECLVDLICLGFLVRLSSCHGRILYNTSAASVQDNFGASWDRFIAPTDFVRFAVGEEEVDDCAKDREDEDEQRPKQLVRNGSVGLEHFDCRDSQSCKGYLERYILMIIMSRTRTMKPSTPPPAPYCQALPWFWVEIGDAPTTVAIARERRT